MADALRASGVEVWFDQIELRGGDAWDTKIREQVETCALFIPIISAHTEARREGYFRLEWNLADERTHLMAHGTPFIVPVVVDGTPERGALVPKSFLAVQWTRLPGGEAPAPFVHRVQTLLGAKAPASSPTRAADAVAMSSGNSRFPFWATMTFAAAVLGIAAYFGLRSPTRETVTPVVAAKPVAETKAPAVPRNGPKSIAVLPFENISEDAASSAFFSDGMHEDIITHLLMIRELRVVPRTTVLSYRSVRRPIREIADELGVAYVLTASVRRADKRIRITGTLMDARTDVPLWSKPYDKEITDVFAIQAELAQAIADELKAAISPQEKQMIEHRPTQNPDAYDLFLKARATKYGESTTVDRREREKFLRAAVELDPTFAAAWAFLGKVYITGYGQGDGQAGLEKANSAIDAAVRLAPDHPAVLCAVGSRLMRIHGDYLRASQQFERAASIQPNDVDAQYGLGEVRRRDGKWADALLHHRNCVRLEPENTQYQRRLVELLIAGRRYDEALTEQRRLVRMLPNNLLEAFFLAWIPFLTTGSTKEAAAFFERLTPTEINAASTVQMRKRFAAITSDWSTWDNLDQQYPASMQPAYHYPHVRGLGQETPAVVLASRGNLPGARVRVPDLAPFQKRLAVGQDSWPLLLGLAQNTALLGQRDEAVEYAKRAVELPSIGAAIEAFCQSSLAFVYVWTNQKDRAVDEYSRLLRVPFSGLNIHEMKRDPAYHPVRGDLRFEALLNDSKNNAPLF